MVYMKVLCGVHVYVWCTCVSLHVLCGLHVYVWCMCDVHVCMCGLHIPCCVVYMFCVL